MTSKERFTLYIKKVPNVPLCEYCKHFCPHYVNLFGNFNRLGRGHCIFPMKKTVTHMILVNALTGKMKLKSEKCTVFKVVLVQSGLSWRSHN